jgi:hypothetical protein
VTSPDRLRLAAVAFAVFLHSLSASAQTAPPPTPPQGAPLTFDQFKAQQLQQLDRVQAFFAQRLAAPDLPPDQRSRLERQQAQLGKFAALPPDQQSQLLRRRFDRIDANHDGVVDAGELQTFRQAQRDRGRAAPGPDGKNDDFWPSQN